MKTQNIQKQKGFTLVEIAIVLVIIGLLLGGVLKGQELIENTKIKSVKTEADNISAAILGYQDRFRSLPGDDAAAVVNVNGVLGTGGTVGNGEIEGAYTAGATLALQEASTIESQVIWQHLRLAGFMSGSERGNPISAFGGVIGVTSDVGTGGISICQTGMTLDQMQLVDTRYDDGDATTGSVRGVTAVAGTLTATAGYVAGDDAIAICITY